MTGTYQVCNCEQCRTSNNSDLAEYARGATRRRRGIVNVDEDAEMDRLELSPAFLANERTISRKKLRRQDDANGPDDDLDGLGIEDDEDDDDDNEDYETQRENRRRIGLNNARRGDDAELDCLN